MQVATKASELGIGQPQFDITDIGVVHHLPWMYVYDFRITAIKPREIASYDTLIYPFDLGCWLCLSGAICAIFITLTIMQKLWSKASAKRSANDYAFEGNSRGTQFLYSLNPRYLWLADILLSTVVLVGQGLSVQCFFREGFICRKLLLFLWVLFANILQWGYMSVFLSTLVTIRYEETIETVADLDQSGLPILILGGTGQKEKFESDPRAAMKRIFGRSVLAPYYGGSGGSSSYPSWVDER